TDFKAALATSAKGEMASLAYGEFLERRGRRADAVAIYDAALSQEPDSTALKAARARAAAGRPAPPPPTVRQGAAEALLAPAAVMMSAKQAEVALAYLRMILKLDPERDEAW